MLLFIALYIINCGISLVQGQILQESTMFISGNVIFTWTSSNDSDYDVLVYRDRTFSSKWIRVYDTQYTVKDVMLNYFIELFVDMRAIVSSEYNIMTYNVSKVKAQIGGSAIMTWTASSFPSTGQYHVYHTYKENRTILSIRSSGVSYEGNTQTSKYTYTSRPFNSTNIEFEIRDITLEDAGYYNGGMSAEAAWSSGGTVLIISAKPQKPEIKGNLTTRVDTYLELTCISKSTSAPDYYSKLVTLSYTWFINNTEIKGEVEKTLKLNVTIEHTCNRYSCIATEEGLDSDRSDTVRTDLLYFDDPVIYVNDEWVSDRIAVDIQEKNPLQIFCYAEGGPTPTVRLGKSQNGGTVILSEARDHWSNYSIGTGAQCSDTGTYVCSGQSTDLNTNTKAIDVNILCEPRLDKEVEMKTITESVKTRIVIIPIVAYPSPVLSKLVWLGPDDLPTNITTSAVLQRNGVIYKHRIISIISGLEDETFGEYKLLYEGKVLTNVFIRREGQILQTSTVFISGDVIFKWTSSNYSLYDVIVCRDGKSVSSWTRVSDTQYTVKDVMLYDFIIIYVNIRAFASSEHNVMTYNVSKVKARIGESAIMRWTASSFPSLGQYHVYHTYKENRTILSISSSGVNYGEDTQTTKYAYTSRPFDSTNIVFEIRDITLEDAGYYNGGMSADAAWAGGGVVLIVSAKPVKPEIKGNLTTLVDTYLKLTCISKSTSTPDYYYKFRALSYTWYINDTRIKGEFQETIRLNVTKGHRYNRYSCTATEEDLESDRSNAVQINLLYGPEQLTFAPKPTFDKGYKFTVKEGDEVGPIFCSADCNPPCNVTWKYKESNGLKDALSENGIILLQSINRNVTQIICLCRWKTESMEKDIALDVQYIDDPIINVNGEWVSDRISVDIQERKPLHLSCFVNGNPTPSVRLGKSQNGRMTILSEAMDHWSNYSFSTGAKCFDTSTYVCYGKSQSTNLKTNKSIGVNILCEPRLDKEAQLKTLTELGKARVLIIPMIAYPPPDLSKLVWLAPNNLPSNITANAVIQSNDIIYRHRVIIIVSGLEVEHYREYKLLYDRKFLTNVIIRKEEDAEDGPLRANIVDVAVPSTLLGITWILLKIYVVSQKWRRNIKTTHQHDEKVNQLEQKSMEQHYNDLQDIGVEKNYSHLDRLDQKTPYEETL